MSPPPCTTRTTLPYLTLPCPGSVREWRDPTRAPPGGGAAGRRKAQSHTPPLSTEQRRLSPQTLLPSSRWRRPRRKADPHRRHARDEVLVGEQLQRHVVVAARAATGCVRPERRLHLCEIEVAARVAVPRVECRVVLLLAARQVEHLQHQTKLRAIEPARPVGVPKGEELPNPLLDLALQLVLPAHARGVRRRHRVPPPGPALLDGPSAPPVVEPNAEPQHALLQPVRLVVVPFQPRLHAPRDESLDGRRVKVRRDSTERFVHRDFGRTRALGPRASLSPLCSDSRGSARLLLLCEELPLIGKSSRRDAKRHDRPSFVRRARTNTRLNPHRCPEREKVGSRAEEKSCSDQASPHGDYDYAGSDL
mmetsp:Transcript_2754/g.9871  ORF Transcript_2754/g.9871 Transcript_2754/m.9871 type:complete len:364 (+) Transcript_2754:3-1094(+)